MHLLEANLALERAAPGRGFAERADAIVRLFETRLFDGGEGILLEHFAADWSAHPDAAKAGVVEPDHHFEWVWLLREHAAVTGRRPSAFADLLFERAREHGQSPDRLVYDELAPDLRPRRRSHRLWPHTEAIKAAAARQAGGDPGAEPFAADMAAVLMRHFLDRPFAGGWIDHLDEALRPIVDYVPASSLYHLFFAAAEAHRAFPGAASLSEAPRVPTLAEAPET